MENDKFLHKWINGTLTKAELEAFKLRPEYESLEAIARNTNELSAPEFDKNKMLSEILNAKKEHVASPKKGRRILLSNWIKYGIAATVLLLTAWFFQPWQNTVVRYEMAKGEKKEGILPDQSTFVLNAESVLQYDEKNWTGNRNIELVGEAFFEVNKGSRFHVITPSGTVQVLGTKFNVRSRGERLEVKCQSGKVAVLSISGKRIAELVKEEAILISVGKEIEKWTFQPSEKASWIDGISKFKRVPLSVVLAELERQFHIQVDAKSVNINEIISCNFQHLDLQLALKTILTPLDLNYKIEGNNVVLSKK